MALKKDLHMYFDDSEKKEKKIWDQAKFATLANKVAREVDKTYTFSCPICGNPEATVTRTSDNFLRAKCPGCDMSVIV